MTHPADIARELAEALGKMTRALAHIQDILSRHVDPGGDLQDPMETVNAVLGFADHKDVLQQQREALAALSRYHASQEGAAQGHDEGCTLAHIPLNFASCGCGIPGAAQKGDDSAAQLAALKEHVKQIKLAAGRHRLALHALARIKDGKTLFELSPTKDQECFEAWQELNDSGVALDQLVTFPTIGILQAASPHAAQKAGASSRREMTDADLEWHFADDEPFKKALRCAHSQYEGYVRQSEVQTEGQRRLAMSDALQHAVGIIRFALTRQHPGVVTEEMVSAAVVAYACEIGLGMNVCMRAALEAALNTRETLLAIIANETALSTADAKPVATEEDFTDLSKEMLAQAEWAEGQGYFAFPKLLMRAHRKLLEFKIRIDALSPSDAKPDTGEDGRREGHSKLVYDKATRTIVTVAKPDPRDEQIERLTNRELVQQVSSYYMRAGDDFALSPLTEADGDRGELLERELLRRLSRTTHEPVQK